MLTNDIKKKLHEACLTFVTARLALEQKGLAEAFETANADTKSSAGDKYETGRAMAHLDQEKFSRMIAETSELRERLMKIDPLRQCESVVPGAAVVTNRGSFYCAISAEDVEINGEEFCTISLASPLGLALAGKVVGESVQFRNLIFVIEEIL